MTDIIEPTIEPTVEPTVEPIVKIPKKRDYTGNKEYQKKYYKENKEKLLGKLKQKTECELCGGRFSYVARNKHALTKKHKLAIFEKQKDNNIDLMDKIRLVVQEEIKKKD
jgi:hypothetical protein